ncbi:MAG: tRNA pseudouridine(38-40) synthase TruA [Spirochaetes bacterium]|nr:tRNA pseudouridine(38-40) synthase TruA [Spirochaetota bacterium]
MKTAMTLEYDGAGYFGFQRQKAQNSVQAELEKALSTVLRQKVRVWCAGRTDTGVNALGQVIHFAADYEQSHDRLIYALNSLLPRDIAIRHAAYVPGDFHARFSCLGREYVYLIYNAPYRPGVLGYKSLWLREKLEWDRIRDAIPHLLGENDFAAFTRVALVKSGERTHRRIDAIDVVHDDTYTYIHIRGSGFLHNMIRILVGTLLDVARGEIPPEKMAGILASADRLEAGVTLKAHPLYFLHAEYKDYDQSAAQHGLRKMLLRHRLQRLPR